MVIPETQASVGGLGLVTVQDNSNSYITLGLGILAITLSLIKEKSY